MLFDEAALRGADELEQFLDLARWRYLGPDSLHGLRGIQSSARQQAERLVQRVDRCSGELAPLQTGCIFAEHLSLTLGNGVRERQHIARDHAVPADNRMPPDSAKLMHTGSRADHRPIPHL